MKSYKGMMYDQNSTLIAIADVIPSELIRNFDYESSMLVILVSGVETSLLTDKVKKRRGVRLRIFFQARSLRGETNERRE